MLTVITGPMFSGKTAELIRLVNRSRISGKVVQVFNYGEDVRYAEAGTVATYDGGALSAIPTLTAAHIADNCNMEASVVVIDEVQFFDDAVIELVRGLIDLKKEVVCAGLNLDFRGEPFCFRNSSRTIAELMVRADKIIKLSAICTYKQDGKPCGVSATRTQRIIDDVPADYSSPVVQIGSREAYEARCTLHHLVPGRPSLAYNFSASITALPVQEKLPSQ